MKSASLRMHNKKTRGNNQKTNYPPPYLRANAENMALILIVFNKVDFLYWTTVVCRSQVISFRFGFGVVLVFFTFVFILFSFYLVFSIYIYLS